MHAVATLMGPHAAMFELSVPCEVFGIHRAEIAGWPYRHVVCSPASETTVGQGGLTLRAGAGLDALDAADTVIVPPWQPTPGHFVDRLTAADAEGTDESRWYPADAVPDDVLDRVRAAHDRGARVVSLCAGAFVLAQAGLLDGRRATTHWMYADVLAERFPAVEVDRSVLYVEDDGIFTAAGTAAGVDLCLHLVRRDLGVEAANLVARRMVVPPHRDGGQAQFIATPVATPTDGEQPLAPLLDWMVEHLDRPLTVTDLAARAGLSERTFARRFTAATGSTPLQWLLAQRVAHARFLLESTDLPVEQVAGRCGFATAAGLRLHFQRQVGTSPLAYRRTFRQVAG